MRYIILIILLAIPAQAQEPLTVDTIAELDRMIECKQMYAIAATKFQDAPETKELFSSIYRGWDLAVGFVVADLANSDYLKRKEIAANGLAEATWENGKFKAISNFVDEECEKQSAYVAMVVRTIRILSGKTPEGE